MSIRYRFLRFPEGKGKAVTLNYDDGSPTDIRFADTITRYGLKYTFNMCGKKTREGWSVNLTNEDVKQHFLKNGHEVAVHGARHLTTGRHRVIESIRDVMNCRLELEDRFDMIIRGMAYPGTGIKLLSGDISYEEIKSCLKNLNIAYARTTSGDNNLFELLNDWYAWMPTAHHDNPNLDEYMEDFLKVNAQGRWQPRLFYLWGHSSDFEHNRNWDLLDKICQKLGNHNDIWYATNMEIYDYVNAYNSLIYSADSTRVYNPTLYTIWFECDDVMYTIKSGETIKIVN